MAQNTVYLVHSDNARVVAVANKDCSHSAQTNAILKHVYHLQADNGIHLHTTFVPTHMNIADALSRGDVNSFLAGFPNTIASAPIPLPPHLVDKLIQSLWDPYTMFHQAPTTSLNHLQHSLASFLISTHNAKQQRGYLSDED